MVKTTAVQFDIPVTLLNHFNQSLDELTEQVRLWTALHLFKDTKITLGQALEIANLPRDEFLIELDRHYIPVINYDPAELALELKRMK